MDSSIISNMKELNIHGSRLEPYCYPLAIRYLMDGVIGPNALVTHRLPVEQFREGLEMAHRPDDSIKVLLIPSHRRAAAWL